MRGKLLGANADGGVISADDGRRYKYELSQWRGDRPGSPGDEVDFDLSEDGTAVDVFGLKAAVPTAAAAPQKQGNPFGVISLICGLLGFTPAFGILFSIAAFFFGRMGLARALAEGDSASATLSKIGMILGIVMFVLAVVVLIIGLGSLGLMFGGLFAPHF